MTIGLRDHRGESPGRNLLARGGSVKHITSRKHFDHLRETYLPSHRRDGGVLLSDPPHRHAPR